jgi:hypothetical protein
MLTLAVVLVVALGGAGGSKKHVSPAAYRSALGKAATRFGTASSSAGAHLSAAQNPLDFSAGADEFQRAIGSFTSEVQRLDPPPAARVARDRLVSILRRLSSEVGAIRDAVNAGDRSRVQSLAAPVQSDLSAVKGAVADLETAAGG